MQVLKEIIEKQQKKLGELETKVTFMEGKIIPLGSKIEDLEQYGKRNCLSLDAIPTYQKAEQETAE